MIPVQPMVMIFGFSRLPQLTITAGSGARSVPPFHFIFLFSFIVSRLSVCDFTFLCKIFHSKCRFSIFRRASGLCLCRCRNISCCQEHSSYAVCRVRRMFAYTECCYPEPCSLPWQRNRCFCRRPLPPAILYRGTRIRWGFPSCPPCGRMCQSLRQPHRRFRKTPRCR